MTGKVIPLRPGVASGAPWYRQFWPWFLIALPATSVLGSIVTLVIAVRNADSLVRPDYYAAGVRINQDLALERVAAQRGITAALRLDPTGREIVVAVSGSHAAAVDRMTLELGHPTHPERSRVFQLRRTGPGEFRAPLDGPLRSRWYARLTPPAGDWRLTARIEIDGVGPIALGGTR